MKRFFDWILAVLTAPMFVGCGADFDPGSRVQGTRVVAVVVDQPYAHPGDTVKIDAVGVDTAGRPLEWGFVPCFAPRATTPFACFQKIAEDAAGGTPPTVTIQASGSYTYTVPTDALARLPAEARPSAYVGLLIVTCPGKIGLGGDTQGMPITCTSGGRALRLDEFEVGVKRLFLREKDRNQNPVVAKVTWDGADWPESEVKEVTPCGSATENRYDRCDGDKHTLAAILADGTRESGVDELGAPFTEDLIVQHYATDGLFEYDVRIGERSATGFVPRAGSSGKTVTLWFVARDNRGGVGWASRRVKVR